LILLKKQTEQQKQLPEKKAVFFYTTIMSDSARPRYLPSRQRRKQQERFHGAFTGGFSAGFFNTVGSREGWKPREESMVEEKQQDKSPKLDPSSGNNQDDNKRRHQQRLEDFMDEQDHAEWGGPASIAPKYSDSSAAAADKLRTNQDRGTIEDWVKVAVEPPSNIGHQLLRILGWREGGSLAYVPEKDSARGDNSAGAADDAEARVILSSKKLRKIQLQQKRVKIPPPKLDTCGLGFEPHQNAPEFKAFQERRRKLAKDRAKLGHSANVYRVSNVVGNDDNTDGDDTMARQRKQHVKNDDEEDVYVSYETVEDFVGNKSVGGFALREDEDDAYDDDPTSLTKVSGKVHLDTEEYNKVIYEHSSDEEDQAPLMGFLKRPNPPTTTATASSENPDLAGVLSSFAETCPASATTAAARNTNKATKERGFSADGRPPLPGFVLGGGVTIISRYPGPDVPLSYQVKRHEFGPDEHPLVLKALSRAVQLEAVDEKRRQALDEALQANAASNAPSQRLKLSNDPVDPPVRSTAPMAGSAFSGLAEAMKNRFTSVTEVGKVVEGGLRQPAKSEYSERKTDVLRDNGALGDTGANEDSSKTEIKLSRTVYQFAPHRLLCKRFHVPVPNGSVHVSADVNNSRWTESDYFQREILNPVSSTAGSATAEHLGRAAENKRQHSMEALTSIFDETGTLKTADSKEQNNSIPGEERPSLDMYKSIYEPESDQESASDDKSNKEHSSTDKNPLGSHHNSEENQRKMESAETSIVVNGHHKNTSLDEDGNSTDNNEVTETSLIPYRGQDKKKKKRSKSRKRSRDRKSHKRERNDDDFSETGDSKEKEHRHRRHKKRSRSLASDDSYLSHSSTSSHERKARKRRRDHKDRKRRKEKKKKPKSK
jgi:hypothetical protein